MTEGAPTPLDADARAHLRARLEASRAALLAALEGVTERDFATNLGDGVTVVRLLARLAAEERADAARLRGEAAEVAVPERPLPPQVVHALAGARYQALQALDLPGLGADAAEALVAGIEAREAAAERVRNRPVATPPPVIPVIQPPGGAA
ncbi:MAG: hypothetical protein AMXMBFR23_00950 [Chloroflexota bacterium]